MALAKAGPFLFPGIADLILAAPVQHMLSGLAAADAGVADVLFLKGDAPGFDVGQLLDLVLAGLVAAPHGFDESTLVVGDVQKFLPVAGGKGAGLPVLQGLLVKAVVNRLQSRGNGGFQFV